MTNRAHRPKVITRIVLGALGVLLLVPAPAPALDPSLDLTQYIHTAWTGRDGLRGSTRSIVQTPDGYLWLGTEFGLVRFDGVRFVPWTPPPGENLPSPNILSLLAARDGTLWIGTIEGLASWKNGKLMQYPGVNGGVLALLEDHEGTVWVGTSARLCSFRGEKMDCHDIKGSLGTDLYYLYGNRGTGVNSLFEDNNHRLWAGTELGLWLWSPGPPKRYVSEPSGTQQGVVRGESGSGLVFISGSSYTGSTYIVRQLSGDKSETYTIPGISGPVKAAHLLRDRNGALWIGTYDQGLLRIYQGKTSRFSLGQGLSGDLVTALFEDHEGSVWVGTTNGVDRFREPVVSTLSAHQGLHGPIWSVLPAHDSSLWIGSLDGLQRWGRGQLTTYRAAVSGRQVDGPGSMNGSVREINTPELPDTYTGSLFEDQRGRIWVSTIKGLVWFENGRFTGVGGLPEGSANAIFADKQDGVWISYPGRGLFHVVNGKSVQSLPWPWSEQGIDPRLSAVVPDSSKGGLWLGTVTSGLAYFKDGRVSTWFGSKDGLGSNLVWNLFVDHEDTLWAATEGGLSRIKDGKVATLTTQNGLPCNAIHWVIEDDAASLWLSADCGLLRIERNEWQAWGSDPLRVIRFTLLDGSDGFRMHAMLTGYSPVVKKSSDGKLWFAHNDGISAIDPLHLRRNEVPPPVHIEQITVDGKTYPVRSGLHLPPRIRNLAIDYTALSLVAPEKVRFRVKLEGQDHDWREFVNRRHVEYSNLAPGKYRFLVMASNNSGLWNETGDVLEFSVAPAYYQTGWFRAILGIAVLGLLWGAHKFRLQRLARQEQKLRHVLEGMPAMAFSVLPDGSPDFVNRRWLDYAGLSKDAGEPQHFWPATIHPGDLDVHLSKWQAALSSGEPFENEARHRSASGEYRWFLVRAVPFRDQSGKIVKWYGTLTDIEDRKRADQERRELEERWRASFESNPTMYFIVDSAGAIVSVNTFGAEQLGYTISELLGQHVLNVFHPPDRDAVQQHANACFAQPGRTMRWEARKIRKDGTMLWVRETANAVFLKKRPVMLIVCEDITDQKRAEEAARRSETELRALIENVPAMVFIALPGPANEFASRRWLEYTGLSAEGTAGTGWKSVVHPEDLERHLEKWRACSANGEPFEDEARFLRAADGKYRWFLVRAVPLCDEAGKVLKWYGFLNDIDDRKRAEQALTRSEAYLAEAQKLSHTGSFGYDPATGKTTYWSEELFRIFGLAPRRGAPDPNESRRLLHPDDFDKVSETCLQGFRTKTQFEQEYRLLLNDGKVRHLHVMWHPVLDKAGEIIEYVGTAADVTERKRAEEERERLRQLEADLAHTNRVTTLGELVASLAHELNQPIAAVVTSANACLRWLAREQPNMERARATAKRIQEEGNRAGEIIRRLRAFYKKGVPPQSESLDINEVAREMLVLLRDEARRRSISMRTDFAANLPKTMADRVQLQQVFMNLILNGIEAMHDTGGELTLKSQMNGNGQLLISISDAGIGLPKDKSSEIFSPFFTTKVQGTGMGLAIARSVIEAHGGRLWATANPERGATFHFTLPAEAVAPQ